MKKYINKLWMWVDDIKNEDNGIVLFLRWIYSIGKISWIHSVITAAINIIIPIFYEKGKYVCMIVAIIIGILDIIFAYLCYEYQRGLFESRRFSAELFGEFSSLIKSLSIFVQNDSGWKSKIYRITSEMVCEKIYSIFRNVFKCETRISVEYTFQKPVLKEELEKYVKMVGRKSKHRSITRKSVSLESKNKYYSYQIFVNNNKGVNILGKKEIQDSTIWYTNPENTVDVKRYVGIAVSVFDDKNVNFILQIDFLNDFKFGENDSKEDIKRFVDNYLLAYVNIVTFSYLLNLSGKKEIMEV